VTDALAVAPLEGPVDATVRVPGSKSITNRALVCAALAAGQSELTGALFADDTEAMLAALATLGFHIEVDRAGGRVRAMGGSGRIPAAEATLDCRMSGTTARFLAPLVALGTGRYVLDAHPAMRARPMEPMLQALRDLGVTVQEQGEPGHLPFAVIAAGMAGGAVHLRGDVSSQFVSGLLLASPRTRGGLQLELTTDAVSRPYLALTLAVMEAFGVTARWEGSRFSVAPGAYHGRVYQIEPDASTASYFFAAAAVCGGRVVVPGLGRRALQGDIAMLDVLERMGASVRVGDDAIEVRGEGELRGVDADLRDLSDTAPTLAVVAACARGPSRFTGIGFIRRKETDRIAAIVTELRRVGVDADEEPDGIVIRPGPLSGARIETYDDHRMAMSFAVLGLRVPGIEIVDPGCVAKTFPDFWTALGGLRGPDR